MTLDAAQKFIQKTVVDANLVCEINQAPNMAEVDQILSRYKMDFSDEEFELAYYNVLSWCQTCEQSEAVKEVKVWWNFLIFTLTQMYDAN